MFKLLAPMVKLAFTTNLDRETYAKAVLPESEWVWPENAPELERQAGLLSAKERRLMALDGPTSSQNPELMEKLCKEKGVIDLYQFCAEVSNLEVLGFLRPEYITSWYKNCK